MTYGHLKPQKATQGYVPRVFGFKLHKKHDWVRKLHVGSRSSGIHPFSNVLPGAILLIPLRRGWWMHALMVLTIKGKITASCSKSLKMIKEKKCSQMQNCHSSWTCLSFLLIVVSWIKNGVCKFISLYGLIIKLFAVMHSCSCTWFFLLQFYIIHLSFYALYHHFFLFPISFEL